MSTCNNYNQDTYILKFLAIVYLWNCNWKDKSSYYISIVNKVETKSEENTLKADNGSFLESNCTPGHCNVISRLFHYSLFVAGVGLTLSLNFNERLGNPTVNATWRNVKVFTTAKSSKFVDLNFRSRRNI